MRLTKDIALLLQRRPAEHWPTHIGRRDIVRDPHLTTIQLADLSTPIRCPLRPCVQRHPIRRSDSARTVQIARDLRWLCVRQEGGKGARRGGDDGRLPRAGKTGGDP